MRAGGRFGRSAASRSAGGGWPAWTSAVRARGGLFDCGTIGDRALADLVLQPEEISEYRLAILADALELLRRPIQRRVRAAARSRRLVYLEDGRPVPGVGPKA